MQKSPSRTHLKKEIIDLFEFVLCKTPLICYGQSWNFQEGWSKTGITTWGVFMQGSGKKTLLLSLWELVCRRGGHGPEGTPVSLQPHRSANRSIKLTQNIHTLPSEIIHLMCCCSCKNGKGPFTFIRRRRVGFQRVRKEADRAILFLISFQGEHSAEHTNKQ